MAAASGRANRARITGGYIRVSSARQRDETDSPASQRQRLADAGCTEFYEDLAVSGFRLEARRHAVAFRAMWRDIANGRLSRLVAVRLDRFARRDSIVLDLVEHCEKHGCEFVTLGTGRIDSSTAAGWLNVKVQLMFAEHYSRLLSESIRGGLHGLWAQGIPARSSILLPIQLQRIPGSKNGVERSPAWDDCRIVIEKMLAQAWSASKCSAFIWERHQRFRDGSAVRKWMSSQHLLGHMCTRKGEVLVADCWPAICTPAEFMALQDRLVPAPRCWGAASKAEIKALSGLTRCCYCGKPLANSATRPRADGPRYLYLQCRTPDCKAHNRRIRAQAAELWLFMQHVGDHLDRIAMAHAEAQAPIRTTSRLMALRQELKAREALPAEFRSAADGKRLAELQREIDAEQAMDSGIDPNVVALLDQRLRVVPDDERWPQPCFLGQQHGDHWGWLEAPGMDRSSPTRNRDLRLLIHNLTVDILEKDPSRWIQSVEWRMHFD